MRKGLPPDMVRWLGMGGRVFSIWDQKPVSMYSWPVGEPEPRHAQQVGYLRAYNRSGAVRMLKNRVRVTGASLFLGSQMRQRDILDTLARGLPEIDASGGEFVYRGGSPRSNPTAREQFPLPKAGTRALEYDPRGAHVVMRRAGEELLGEVVEAFRRADGGWSLRVRFMNGQPWPVEPNIGAVEVLPRTYENPGAFNGSKRGAFLMVHYAQDASTTLCGRTITDPALRQVDWSKVTCPVCVSMRPARNPRKHSRTKKNPPLVVFGNPRRQSSGGKLLSKRAMSIRYVHAADGQRYEHKFKPGDCIELLPDGSFRIYREDGKRLWRDFQ